MAIHFSDSNFASEVITSDKPVLVDFWAPWCGPCKMVGPIIEKLANEIQTVKIGKLNIDDNPKVTEQFAVQSIPTLMVFKGGKVVSTVVGYKNEAELRQLIAKASA